MLSTEQEHALKNFTFGVEIEGTFGEGVKPFMAGRLKSDGSVNVPPSTVLNPIAGSEFESPIYTDYKQLLSIFDILTWGVNYFANETCGIHVHLSSPKELYKVAFSDYDWQKALYLQACDWCDEQGARLRGPKGQQYCSLWDTKEKMMYERTSNEKRRFMRWHPQGTVEFRFLAACPHSQANVEKLLVAIADRIIENKVESVTTVEGETDTTELVHNVTVKLGSATVEYTPDIRGLIPSQGVVNQWNDVRKMTLAHAKPHWHRIISQLMHDYNLNINTHKAVTYNSNVLNALTDWIYRLNNVPGRSTLLEKIKEILGSMPHNVEDVNGNTFYASIRSQDMAANEVLRTYSHITTGTAMMVNNTSGSTAATDLRPGTISPLSNDTSNY